jgi:phosphoribosyl 1,2-cyclic phosphodiesterase
VLRFKSLGSGSAGNATLVEARGQTGTRRLLVDCGLRITDLLHRMTLAGVGPGQIDALFVTHEHSDHIGSATQFSRRFKTPVWMSAGTYEAVGKPAFDGGYHQAKDGHPIDLGELLVMPFTVPHDAREPLQLTCTDGARRLGILTDIGHMTPHVAANLAGSAALLLECNHDTDMLTNGRYPHFLKQRVGGPFGHLCNADAADIARTVNHAGLNRVVAAHLSSHNNRPDLAKAALADALGWDTCDVTVADQISGCDWLTV